MLKPVEIESKNWKYSIGTELLYKSKSLRVSIRCRVIGYHYGTPDKYQLCYVNDVSRIWAEERDVVDTHFDVCLSFMLNKL
jgi:hypothetical protein